MSIPFVMPRSGQKGFARFVRRTSFLSTRSFASPADGISMRDVFFTTKVAKPIQPRSSRRTRGLDSIHGFSTISGLPRLVMLREEVRRLVEQQITIQRSRHRGARSLVESQQGDLAAGLR